jgi:hypothetical protein
MGPDERLGSVFLGRPAMLAFSARGLPRESVDTEQVTISPTAGRRALCEKALMCINILSPPAHGEIKPYPFSSFHDVIFPLVLTNLFLHGSRTHVSTRVCQSWCWLQRRSGLIAKQQNVSFVPEDIPAVSRCPGSRIFMAEMNTSITHGSCIPCLILQSPGYI